MASSQQQESKHKKLSISKDLMDFPIMNSSLRSKLNLSEQARKAKGPPKTFKVGKSSVLDRVQTFMPLMAEADEKLKQDLASLPTGSLDIENVSDDQALVEMNLALFENDYNDSSESESELSSSSNEEETSGNEEIMKTEYIENGQVTEDNFVVKKSGKKPAIEVLENVGCCQIDNSEALKKL